MNHTDSKMAVLALLLASVAGPTGTTLHAAEPDFDSGSGIVMTGRAEGIFAAGSGGFAPYYIVSNNHGILTQSGDALLRDRKSVV